MDMTDRGRWICESFDMFAASHSQHLPCPNDDGTVIFWPANQMDMTYTLHPLEGGRYAVETVDPLIAEGESLGDSTTNDDDEWWRSEVTQPPQPSDDVKGSVPGS